MELIKAKVPKGEWTARISGDWQVGSTTSSTKIIEKIMEPVNERSDYRLVLVGDLVDNISVKDKRHSIQDLDLGKPTLFSQMNYVEDTIRHAARKKRILAVLLGNHEATSFTDVGDPTWEMCKDLDVPYGGYSCIMRFNDQDEALFWHGRPSISSTMPDAHSRNMALKRRLVRTNRARWPQYGKGTIKLFAQGHVNHLLVVNPEESRQMDMGVNWDGPDGPEITNRYDVSDAAWYVCAGSAQRLFVQGKTSYAEAKGYGPLSLGCVDAHFRGGRLIDCEPIYLG